MKREVRKMPLPDFLVEKQAASDAKTPEKKKRRNNWRGKNKNGGNNFKGNNRRKSTARK